MNMKAWSDLPNAKYIDQIFSDLDTHPECFAKTEKILQALGVYSEETTLPEARACQQVPFTKGGLLLKIRLMFAAHPYSSYPDAWRAIVALMAWDHSAKYLEMPHEKLLVWYRVNEDPAALLLLPYVLARELIAEKVEV